MDLLWDFLLGALWVAGRLLLTVIVCFTIATLLWWGGFLHQ